MDSTLTTRLVQSTLTGTPAEIGCKCKCGKICKNLRGLRIHQARSACGQRITQKQRTSVTLGETQEDLSQESPHSTRDLSAYEQSSDSTQKGNDGAQISGNEERDPLLDLLYSQDDSEPNTDVPQQNPTAADSREDQQNPKIDWPKTSDKKAWEDLDRELDLMLEATLQGPAERKVKAMTSLIYSVSRERFGTLEGKHTKPSHQPNRRQRQIIGIKKELKDLRKAFKTASPVEKIGLQELRDIQRKHLGTLRKAEQTRQKRRKRARQRAAFTANPYQFSKWLFDKEKSGNLQDSLEDIQQFLKDTHSDPLREDPLGHCPRIEPVAPPTTPLDSKERTLAEVKVIVRKARTGSAP